MASRPSRQPAHGAAGVSDDGNPSDPGRWAPPSRCSDRLIRLVPRIGTAAAVATNDWLRRARLHRLASARALAILLAWPIGVAPVQLGAGIWSTLSTIPLISLLIAVPALDEELS